MGSVFLFFDTGMDTTGSSFLDLASILNMKLDKYTEHETIYVMYLNFYKVTDKEATGYTFCKLTKTMTRKQCTLNFLTW